VFYIPKELNTRVIGDTEIAKDQPLSLEVVSSADKEEVRYEWTVDEKVDPI